MIAFALAILAGLGLVVYAVRAQGAPSSAPPSSAPSSPPADAQPSPSTVFQGSTTTPASTWELPARGEPFAASIRAAEFRYNLPPMLLARVLWQESRFREDIITGAVRDSAGSIGIAQFQQATADRYGVDPLNPFQSIEGAAHYLRDLFNQFGDWASAIAAYNWGEGNLAKFGIARAPRSTRAYVAGVLADIGLTT